MAEVNKEVKQEVEKINKQAEINEAYFVGLLWSDPFNHYSSYADNLSQEEFIHDVWRFFYELGRRMYLEGVKLFDDITVHTKVKEYNVTDTFEEYGGMDTITDVINIVKDNVENVDYYYETIKKNYVIRELYKLFGDKVLIKKGKYDYSKMTREQLADYWHDRVNKISLVNVDTYEVENLYIEPDEFIEQLEKDAAEMLPFYKSPLLNSISQGVPRGHITMIGGFGGLGKTSVVAEKIVMSFVENREKTLVILNEEDAQAFRQKIVLTILFHEFKTGIDRRRFVNGKLTNEDKEKIRKAFAKMKELMDGDEPQIKLIYMNKYVVKDLEKLVRFWANRGYTNLVIDTHKVSDEYSHNERWVTFVEDTKSIYRITRKNAGGLNLRTVLTFQLADVAVSQRFLDYEAIGEGKASKNEASIVFMFRPIWADEYPGGKQALECFRFKKLGDKYIKEPIELDKSKPYYLWFTPKNRFGQQNDNGQPVLILEPMLNYNHFKEVGWTFIRKTKSR